MKKRKSQVKKNNGPDVEIVGLTPELQKMASQEYDDPWKDQAKNFEKKGWGKVEPLEKKEPKKEQEKKVIKKKMDATGFELLISEKDQAKIEARREKEEE